jgi:hypothetical protein
METIIFILGVFMLVWLAILFACFVIGFIIYIILYLLGYGYVIRYFKNIDNHG